MPAYDGDLFSPPAPVATVTLRNPATGAVIADVRMLLDTGADVTLLPQTAVEQLGVNADASGGYELMGFDGRVSTTRAVSVDLLFLRRAFKGRFLLIDQGWGIIGRDILNHVSLLFDGAGLRWEETPRSG